MAKSTLQNRDRRRESQGQDSPAYWTAMILHPAFKDKWIREYLPAPHPTDPDTEEGEVFASRSAQLPRSTPLSGQLRRS
ncbi:Uncharacterized protein HZ326_22635 [Fusarium oxysporum f. sp. albedinis]|nr:Uncharacterized protein HZ326_22635 [Fusarium oxysporum f. sp. albedinis]